MEVKVRFRDDWRWYQRGDEADLDLKLAETLAHDLIVDILEKSKTLVTETNPKSKMEKKPPRDKMLRGGNKRIKNK